MYPLFDLTGKVALVTGAKVALCSRKAEACEQVLNEFKAQGFDALAMPCNVSRKEDLTGIRDDVTIL